MRYINLRLTYLLADNCISSWLMYCLFVAPNDTYLLVKFLAEVQEIFWLRFGTLSG